MYIKAKYFKAISLNHPSYIEVPTLKYITQLKNHAAMSVAQIRFITV